MSAPSDLRVRAIHALCMDTLVADLFGRPGDALQELGVDAARLAADINAQAESRVRVRELSGALRADALESRCA
jgi:hypothetical protein